MSEREASWLGPIAAAYEKEMGAGTFPYGKAARFLAPLFKAGWTPEVMAERVAYYIRSLKREGKLTYLSFPRLVELWAAYDPRELAFDE